MAATSGAIAVGISLGSESCTLAVAPATTRDANGTIVSDVSLLARPTIIAAEDGERSTPAFGAWVNSELLAGAPGKNAALRHPQRSIGCMAPLLSKVKEFQCLVKAKVDYAPAETTLSEIEENEDGTFAAHPVSELLLALFQQMNKLAVGAAGTNPIASVVVSVPRYVCADKVLALLQKVEFPGTALIEVMYDDCAAALANGICGPNFIPKTFHNGCLVIDVGATATSASVLQVAGGTLSLLSTDFITTVCGKKIDAGLAASLIETFRKKSRSKIDADELTSGRPYRKLLIAAEKAKKTLTSSQTANCEVEAFYDGADLAESVTRGKLEGIVNAELNAIKLIEDLVEKVLKTAADATDGALAISHVVLHGGAMRIPAVQNGLKEKILDTIENVIENDDQLDMLDDGLVQILDGMSGDEAAALGASIHASLAANGCDTSGHKVEKAQLKRDALTFDIGFWAGEEAPKLNGDGEVEVPKPADEDEGDDDEDKAKKEDLEPLFAMLVQKGSPVPTEVTVTVPAEASLLLLARTGFKQYVPLASSVTVPKPDNGNSQNLHVEMKADGTLNVTVLPAGMYFAPEVAPLVSSKVW